MGKNKLKKFAELKEMKCALQYPRERLIEEGFPFTGRWNEDYFKNGGDIVLELGCGKGEYTVGLARVNPDKNFIGVDIKGARIWSGAKEATQSEMANVAFLRTEIENIEKFFKPGEVSEIWITFPDPQMQKQRKRLTSTGFLKKYAGILKSNGIIHLKTDSPFLYEYTRRLAKLNDFDILTDSSDIYGEGIADSESSIKTFYEDQWLSRGKKIKLLSFHLANTANMQEPPTEDIEKDDYRAYARHTPLSRQNK